MLIDLLGTTNLLAESRAGPLRGIYVEMNLWGIRGDLNSDYGLLVTISIVFLAILRFCYKLCRVIF